MSPSVIFMKKSGRQGFSLVEVVLSIGVVSFALLGTVALIPNGLRMSREAADATTESQIIQFVRNQLQLTAFTSLKTSWDGKQLYFDKDGLPTTATDPAQIYTVNLSIVNVSMDDPNNITTDMSASSAQDVKILIVNRTAAGSSASNSFSLIVPNIGS